MCFVSSNISVPKVFFCKHLSLVVDIAQFEFGYAVDLVLKASTWVAENCHKSTDSARDREATLDLENRTQNLIQVLASELSTQKSFQVRR